MQAGSVFSFARLPTFTSPNVTTPTALGTELGLVGFILSSTTGRLTFYPGATTGLFSGSLVTFTYFFQIGGAKSNNASVTINVTAPGEACACTRV